MVTSGRRPLLAVGLLAAALGAHGTTTQTVGTTTQQASLLPGLPTTSSGQATIDSFQCTDPADDQTETSPITLTLDGGVASAGNIVVSGSGSSDDANVNLALFFDSRGVLVGGGGTAQSPDNLASFTVTGGGFTGDKLTIQITGSEQDTMSPFDACLINGTINLAISGGGAISPAVTTSARVVTPITLQRQVTTVLSSTFRRIASVRRGRATGALPTADGFMIQGGSGLNAGDGFASPLGGWLTYGYADFENDFGPLAFEGDRHSGLGGVDFNPAEGLLVGIAAGYETVQQDTLFNAGEIEADGFTITPYLGYQFNDVFSVDFALGYSALEVEQFRTASGERLSSEFDSDRWFWGGNINAVQQVGNWYLTGNAGITWAREFQDGFTERNEVTGQEFEISEQEIRFGQWRVGGEAAYALGMWEPYVSATYQRDYAFTELVLAGAQQPENDLDDVYFAAGVRYYGGGSITGYAEYTRIFDRADYEEYGLNFLLRMEF